jgi:hypothetical protein
MTPGMGQKATRAGRVGYERIEGCRDGIALRSGQDGWDDGKTVAKKSVKEHGGSWAVAMFAMVLQREH